MLLCLIHNVCVPGRFITLAVSKWPSNLSGHFKTSLGFETAGPFQNPSDQSIVDLFTIFVLLDKVSNCQTLFRS